MKSYNGKYSFDYLNQDTSCYIQLLLKIYQKMKKTIELPEDFFKKFICLFNR